MTNLYNLSLRPKIVFIHGINNNAVCFDPIIDHFQKLGFETELLILPGHGTNRQEAKTLDEANLAFEKTMERLNGQEYFAVGFSHGALYLQLWLEKNAHHPPLKQVLLAPALYIHRQKVIEKLLRVIPSFVKVISLSPKAFRRYEMLSAWEYNILVSGMVRFQKLFKGFKCPTLILIDPKDELVSAPKIKEHFENVEFIERPYLKKGIGQHHIIFRPEYFEGSDWKKFTRKIEIFLGINVEV